MTEPELSDAEKQEFRDIADNIADGEFNQLLNHDLARVRLWRRKADRSGYRPTLSDLVRQMMDKRTSRHRTVAAYSAALWRLTTKECERERDQRQQDRT